MTGKLCCCEYVDQYGQETHLLGCCCNCKELDDCFDRLISGRKISWKHIKNIMVTASDRLRIPWMDGARKISLDALLPTLLLPLFILSASQGVWMSVVAFAFLPIFLIYAHFLYMKLYAQTYFFFFWNITSTLFISTLFEFVAVDMLFLRNDEHFAFIMSTIGSIYCLYKVKQKERLSHINNEYKVDQTKLGNYCQDCKIRMPVRANHCYTCQVCVMQRDQHCAWLNCCIAQFNHIWYMLFLFCTLCQLLLFSNLVLTTACKPFHVWGTLMLPDDCTDVYHDKLIAVCFVTSVYCLEAAIFIVAVIIHESWLITIGMTGDEFRNRSKRSLCCGIFAPRPYSKGCLRNWIHYLKGSVNKRNQYFNI